MDAREQRGLEIAAKCRIRKVGDWFHVPSQTTRHMKYTVRAKAGKPVCNCPDHETRGVRCKHIFAVLFTLEREAVQMMLDGHTAASVAERLGISCPTLLYRWKQRQLRRGGPVAASLDDRVRSWKPSCGGSSRSETS